MAVGVLYSYVRTMSGGVAELVEDSGEVSGEASGEVSGEEAGERVTKSTHLSFMTLVSAQIDEGANMCAICIINEIKIS